MQITTAQPDGVVVNTPGSDLPATDDVEGDAAWTMVRTAAEGLRWEDAHAVGLTAAPGALEGLAV